MCGLFRLLPEYYGNSTSIAPFETRFWWKKHMLNTYLTCRFNHIVKNVEPTLKYNKSFKADSLMMFLGRLTRFCNWKKTRTQGRMFFFCSVLRSSLLQLETWESSSQRLGLGQEATNCNKRPTCTHSVHTLAYTRQHTHTHAHACIAGKLSKNSTVLAVLQKLVCLYPAWLIHVNALCNAAGVASPGA